MSGLSSIKNLSDVNVVKIDVNWIVRFFQGQFIHVLFFGIFAGYFFRKSKGNLWAVFACHALMNIAV